MVDLMGQYEKAGLQLDCRELPDYLPLYLEYLSIVSDDEAREAAKRRTDSGADWRPPEAARRGALSAV
jgi:nitrate reductase assembly molybdenum cofactor insertion protein NarJ